MELKPKGNKLQAANQALSNSQSIIFLLSFCFVSINGSLPAPVLLSQEWSEYFQFNTDQLAWVFAPIN